MIGTNKKDAADTVARILEDRDAGKLNAPEDADPRAASGSSPSECPDLVTWEGWRAIDVHETGLGEPQGRPRVKLVRTGEMVEIASGVASLRLSRSATWHRSRSSPRVRSTPAISSIRRSR